MEILNYDRALHLEGVATATIGVFDGVHRGHQSVLGQLMKEAHRQQTVATVITFDRHPLRVVYPEKCPPLLTTLDERLELLAAAGVQRCVVLPFTEEMARMAARDFMWLMHRQLGVQLLLTGYDNRFGHDRTATFEDYVRYGKEAGMRVEVLSPAAVLEDGHPVNSSSVRRLLAEGQLERARHCLGRDYSIEGRVVDGAHVGRRIGYPTANISPDACKLVPKEGAYAVWASVGGEETLRPAMMNIGTCPTFGDRPTTLEVHLFDYAGDLYGRPVRVRFVSRLRDEQRFADMDGLKRQLSADREAALRALNTETNEQKI